MHSRRILLAAAAAGGSALHAVARLDPSPPSAPPTYTPLTAPHNHSLEHHLLHGALKGAGRVERYELSLSDESPPRLLAAARLGDRSCGHPLFLHGGAIAALLDDCMGMLFLSLGKGTGFTANLSVDYRNPIPHGTELHVTAALERTEVSQKSGATKVFLRAEVRGAASNKLYAEGRALFVVKPPQLGMLLAGALGSGGGGGGSR